MTIDTTGRLHLLLATDLSERSDRALERAARLARGLGARLTVLHVVDDELPTQIAEDIARAARETIERLIAGEKSRGEIDASVSIVSGRDFETIIAEGNRISASLIILGTHRSDSIGDVFHGATMDRVLRFGDRPVLIAKSRALADYGNILVAVDLSEPSRQALEFAMRLFPQSRIEVVHVYEIPFAGFLRHDREVARAAAETHRGQLDELIRQSMDAVTSDLGECQWQIEPVLRRGEAAAAIGERVAQRGIDLAVIGTHGRTGLGRALIGSIAEQLMSCLPCDVLAVRPGPTGR